jgi:hypothetical protein
VACVCVFFILFYQMHFLLTMEKNWVVLSRYHHLPHIVFVMVYALLELLPSPKKKPVVDSHKKQKAA